MLRPSVVFGPEDAMFNRMAQIARQAPFLPVVGDGSARVQPVYVGDVGAAVVAVLERPDTAKSVFELGGPHVYTYREIGKLVLREIDRHKRIIGIPAGLMKIAGFLAEFLPVPPLTHDQVDLLVTDNVTRPGAPGLAELGITPTAAEAILPMYLDRYRIGGRYNQHAPA
jgi:NADH dehydrogenase